jgi:RNA polymerase sigma-70 factor (ECF subfamily)
MTSIDPNLIPEPSHQPTESFESYRPLMFSIAYRMLGSAMDAEDIVQEAYLRYQRTPADSIQSPRAWLSTVITRLCLNQLESARVQREQYIGPWLPEPILTNGDASAAFTVAPVSPAQQFNALESISLAFLVLLESLTPVERAVFLLREVFDYDYEEIAAMVGKSEPACRQLFSRAKKHIAEHRPRFKSSPEEHRRLVTQFIEAVQNGELENLTHLLAEEVTLWSDGGGKVFAALTPLKGNALVARFLLGTRKLAPNMAKPEITDINGAAGVILRNADGKAFVVITAEVDQGVICALRVVGNPDKLHNL